METGCLIDRCRIELERMKQALGQWSVSCGRTTRARSAPGFVTLSHCSRTFHHKSRPIPPTAVEKFRATATAPTNRHAAADRDPSSPPLALSSFLLLHSRIPACVDEANSTTTAVRTRTTLVRTRPKRSRLRFYSALPTHSTPSSSSTPPAMADEQVHWSAAKVRETFLHFFEERGHTIGKLTPPLSCCDAICVGVPRHGLMAQQQHHDVS